MPISGPSSYIPTINLFLAHWEDAEGVQGSPITVPPQGTTRGELENTRDALEAARAKVEDRINDVEIGNATLAQQKTVMIAHVNDFNRRVRGLLPGTPFVNGLPEVPRPTSAQSYFTKPLIDMASLWGKINTAQAPDPFLLAEGYDRATFETDLETLNEAYVTDYDNEQEVKLARDERNAIQEEVLPILVGYRRVIEALFAPGSPIVQTLPRVTPLPGHTPQQVTAQGVWDASAGLARITFSESTDANLQKYELRTSPVTPYSTGDEQVLASLQPEDPREFTTTAGLEAPGDSANYRVYVILDTGNENGSDTVTVQRPAE